MSVRHPDHEPIAESLRKRYRTSDPSMGYVVEPCIFGCYCHNLDGRGFARLIVERVTPGDVATMLADARRYFGAHAIDIWLDDRRTDADVAPALTASGCARGDATVYLAYVGLPQSETRAPGVVIEAIDAATVEDYARVKLKGFANSESEPSPEALAQEIAARRGELDGAGRLLIARAGAESAAIIGFYEGDDRLIFNLATRLPLRNRGLARHLLCRVLADSFRRGCRSVVINTNPDDTPIEWYRRLGFVDEVYWHRTYTFRV